MAVEVLERKLDTQVVPQTAGLILIRVPDAFNTTITNGGSNQVVTGGYRYIRLTSPGTIKFIDS